MKDDRQIINALCKENTFMFMVLFETWKINNKKTKYLEKDITDSRGKQRE